MCNKCNPNPCGCTSKNICQKDIPSDNIIYTSNVNVACLGIQPGTPLTEALQAIGDAYCDLQTQLTGASAILTNIGDGEGVYASETIAGAKQLKSIDEGTGIEVTSDADTITVSVDEAYIQSLINTAQDENIVEFNTANPNSGSPTFNPNTPQDDDAIYFSTVNSSFWKWNGSTYVTYTPPQNTPFNIAGTSNDAGANKTAAISRTGAIGVNIATPLQALHVGGTIRQSAVISSLLKTNASGDLIAAVAGTDYLTPTGSAVNLTNFPILNQNTTGNAATVTTNANLTGDVTSVGNATTLSTTGVTAGSYTSPTMTVDAKGRVTAIANGGGARALMEIYTDSQNIGSGSTPLYALFIPANTSTQDGDKFEAHFSGSLLSPGINKQLQVTLGSSSFSFSTTQNGSFSIKALFIRTSSSTIRVSLQFNGGTASNTYDATWSGSIDFTSLMTVTLSGQGTNTGDIVSRIGTLSFLPKAA